MMDYKFFIKETVCKFQQPMLNQMKESLLGKYITFSMIHPENVNIDILAEKLCDYFETLEIKTGKSFDKQLESYMNDLNTIVNPWIAKAPQNKKGDTSVAIVPRSRKYYERALVNKNTKDLTLRKILDYSRIMFCLYMEIINQYRKVIDSFDYSADCLNPIQIVGCMENERVDLFLAKDSKKRFDTKDPYNSDSCTMILSIISLYSIKNESMMGDNEYE